MEFAWSLVSGGGGGCLKFWTVLCILVTAAHRLALLGFCLKAPNAIFVSLFPAQYRQSQCESLTVVRYEESNGDLWHRISGNETETENLIKNLTVSHDTEQGLPQTSPEITDILTSDSKGDLFGKSQGVSRVLLYKVQNEEDGWYILNQNHIHHHSDYGYQSYYYYCGDVTMFLNTTWVPVLTWLTVNIIPILLLVILSNVPNLNIFLKLPDIIPLSLLSHFIIGTVKEDQEAPNSQTVQKRKYGVSKLLSALNILLSGVSTIVTLYLCFGQRFGAGDGAFLRWIIPLFVLVPIG